MGRVAFSWRERLGARAARAPVKRAADPRFSRGAFPFPPPELRHGTRASRGLVIWRHQNHELHQPFKHFAKSISKTDQ